MESRTVIKVQIIFAVISLTSSVPLALRTPLRDIRDNGPSWSELRKLRFHSEEEKIRNDAVLSAVAADSSSIPLIRKRFHFPSDEQQDPVDLLAYRNSIPDGSSDGTGFDRKLSSERSNLERFYKHAPSGLTRGREIIVFPKDDPAPAENKKDDAEESDVIRFRARSEEILSDSKPIEENPNEASEIASKSEDQSSSSSSTSSQSNENDFLSLSEVDESPTEKQSESSNNDNEELSVREQSLYSGPTIKSNEDIDAGCPEGMKRTRNGSCQKPSRRLIQTG